jgi:hypothetical protein
MGKLLGLFGGRKQDEGGREAEGSAGEQATPAAPAAEPAPIPDAHPLYVPPNPYASIDDYAASLPAPDFVDPAAGKASDRSEAA